MVVTEKLIKNWNSIRIYLLFILGIVFVILLFPKEGKFRYEFQKGKPWLHEVLVAPFDFPIYKTESLVQSEKDSALMRFVPYFKLDSSVNEIIIQRFDDNFGLAWQNYLDNHQAFSSLNNQVISPYYYRMISMVRDSYYRGIETALNTLYAKGIIVDPEQLDDIKTTSEVIKIISGKLVEERLSSSVYTQKTAYEFLNGEFEKIGSLTEPSLKSDDRFIRSLEIMDYIEPNLFYDVETSTRMQQDLIEQISLTEGMVQAGEKIIALGELVNEEKFQILQSLKREYETNPTILRNYTLIRLGQSLMVIISFIMLYLFFLNFRKEILTSSSKTFFIILLVMIFALLAVLTIRNERISLFVVPFVIVPIILKTFYDSRIAIFVHTMTIILVGFWAPNGFNFIFMNFIAGLVAIYATQNMYRRGALFVSAMFTFFTYALVYSALGLMEEGRFANLDPLNYAWFGGNAFLILTAYPLIFIFEKIFGFLSDSTLFELADTNQPILRKLAELAPGTFQHSLQVGNLAEEGVLKVGGNPLLVRTGALYHDIGKLEEPIYFIENQSSYFNPHDNLTEEESAGKIIAHVVKGVEIAKKEKLPESLIDFIRTHHGTTTVQYFYRSFMNKFPGTTIDTGKFAYPGPKPNSKETAIIMMADSIEAASRSLKIVDSEKISELVDRIIERQLEENQFENVDLTFRDVQLLKQVFKEKLGNIYHKRIEYPK